MKSLLFYCVVLGLAAIASGAAAAGGGGGGGSGGQPWGSGVPQSGYGGQPWGSGGQPRGSGGQPWGSGQNTNYQMPNIVTATTSRPSKKNDDENGTIADISGLGLEKITKDRLKPIVRPLALKFGIDPAILFAFIQHYIKLFRDDGSQSTTPPPSTAGSQSTTLPPSTGSTTSPGGSSSSTCYSEGCPSCKNAVREAIRNMKESVPRYHIESTDKWNRWIRSRFKRRLSTSCRCRSRSRSSLMLSEPLGDNS